MIWCALDSTRRIRVTRSAGGQIRSVQLLDTACSCVCRPGRGADSWTLFAQSTYVTLRIWKSLADSQTNFSTFAVACAPGPCLRTSVNKLGVPSALLSLFLQLPFLFLALLVPLILLLLLGLFRCRSISALFWICHNMKSFWTTTVTFDSSRKILSHYGRSIVSSYNNYIISMKWKYFSAWLNVMDWEMDICSHRYRNWKASELNDTEVCSCAFGTKL